MNRTGFLLLLSILTVSCVGKHQSEAQKIIVSDATEHIAIEADTLKINVAKSKIDWVATEMRGTKRRTGKISFQDGFFLTANSEIAGGHFTVNMASMDVTDVPIYEKFARKNLIDHLNSDDFFNVALYPLSTLELTGIEK
ncbi:MAG: YceI family protein [Flavobacteriales bacterium]|nr:YceI family protein [Flavobacteriales bacterium]